MARRLDLPSPALAKWTTRDASLGGVAPSIERGDHSRVTSYRRAELVGAHLLSIHYHGGRTLAGPSSRSIRPQANTSATRLEGPSLGTTPTLAIGEHRPTNPKPQPPPTASNSVAISRKVGRISAKRPSRTPGACHGAWSSPSGRQTGWRCPDRPTRRTSLGRRVPAAAIRPCCGWEPAIDSGVAPASSQPRTVDRASFTLAALPDRVTT